MAKSRTLMALLAIAATMVIELAMAANYTVGNSDGWEIGTDFESWVSSKKFTVGDVLNFEYSPNHNVLEVSERDFSSCDSSNPLAEHTGGVTAIALSTPGKRYFICGIAGHCTAGMLIEIDTLPTSSPPADTPPPSPPPTSPPASPPAKPPAKTPSAPPPGSGVSPPAPPTEPSSPSPTPSPDSPTPPFPSFDLPPTPMGVPTTPTKRPPPPSSAYKCSFRVDLSIGFSFVIVMLLVL